jgi:hypothetical protein
VGAAAFGLPPTAFALGVLALMALQAPCQLRSVHDATDWPVIVLLAR